VSHDIPAGTEPDPTRGALSRRAALASGGTAAASAALLAAGCATYAPAPESPASSAAPAGGASASSSAAPGSANPGAGTGAAATGTALGPASAVPVGGGKVFQAQKVVVTQPTAGAYKAYTAVCPHQGCLVNKVAAGTISCPCHGSEFSAADGSVTEGPAKKGLAAKKVSAVDGTLRLS
jgi:Rieske Fe-S protein